MAKILVAEDTPAVREALVALLESEFHSVLSTDNGQDAVDLFWKVHPDLLLLDIMMPRKSGFDVCREVRSGDQSTPIMFLSAKADEADKVLGLGLGADDYLAKPFGTHELLARISSLLRRSHVSKMCDSSVEVFRVGEGTVIGNELVFVTSSGERIGITHREYRLLRLLNARIGQVVTKEEIMNFLWGENYLPNSRTLEQHLYNLRRKVEGNGFQIVTVPRCGIRLQLI